MKTTANNLDSAPWVADNGLRVESRSSQGFKLAWTPPKSKVKKGSQEEGTEEEDNYIRNEGPTGPWFELQMKKGFKDAWKTIYRGYGQRYTIIDLVPDVTVYFRMKRNGEEKWGSTITAATDSALPSAEDLQRAVSCRAEDMITRIIETSTKVRLRALLKTLDNFGMTPLMISCLIGTPEIVKMLLEAGSEVNYQTPLGERTALMYACMNGDLKILKLLDFYQADWKLRDTVGCTAIHYGINCDKILSVNYAVQKRGWHIIHQACVLGWTALLRSVIFAESDLVPELLLHKGADANAVDKANVKSCLIAAVMLGKKKIYSLLLTFGADPYFRNANGHTALDIAISLHDREAVQYLEDWMRQLNPNYGRFPTVLVEEIEDEPESRIVGLLEDPESPSALARALKQKLKTSKAEEVTVSSLNVERKKITLAFDSTTEESPAPDSLAHVRGPVPT